MSDFVVDQSGRTARVGVGYGLLAYGWWGLVPIYFKAVETVPALEVLAHRIVWSVILLVVWLRIQGRWRVAASALRDRRTAITLLATTVLIAVNWYLFIWGVANDQVMQASLGYFINPLVNVLLGFVFLRERLRRWQTFSVALATVGVVYLTVGYGQFPWLALALAGSFGLYGLLRKTAPVDAPVGLTAETVLLLPMALAYLVYQFYVGSLTFGAESRTMDALLIFAGAVTALPLLWFTNSARRLRLATLGFLQYIAPSGHFLLALLYGEPFTVEHAVSFGCIWTALAIYSVDTARGAQARRESVCALPPSGGSGPS
jgi:chloramphenicol-sensitive protein RarD